MGLRAAAASRTKAFRAVEGEMTEPEFIDNLDGNTLASALRLVLAGKDEAEGTAEATSPPARLDMAVAFFSPAGFAEIARDLARVEQIRLLVGAEPPSLVMPPKRSLEETTSQFEKRLLREGLINLEEGLRQEGDALPFTRAARNHIRKLITVLKSGRMETRRYERAFLHAKAYIFAPQTDAPGGGVIAGSSNLTHTGTTKNLELNLGRYDAPVVQRAQNWFERLWGEAVPFDLIEFLEEIFTEWASFDVFLRVLWQLYGAEVEALEKEDEGLPLTSFQKHGAARALRLIQESGGAIVADEVGLGKTFIAGEIMNLYKRRRQRCLLVCPAQLRDTTWRKFRSNYFLGDVECRSYEDLAIDRQIAMADPDAFRDKLQRNLNEYQLVVVDEAHNYRNPSTPTRAAVLRKLLWGQRRDVLLLTATPVNNSLWDLFHLLRFFIRQDSFLADRGVLSIKERFDRAAREDPAALSPDILYPVIDATTVKRTRQFVKKHYGGDSIKLPDGTTASIVFPEPRPITLRYELTDPLPELFDLIEELLDPDQGPNSISFSRYTTETFRLDSLATDDDEGARSAATVGLLRSGLLKRFESSAFAVRKTVAKLIREHETFIEALDKGHVITTRFLHELEAADESVLDDLLESSSGVTPAGECDWKALRLAVEDDLAKLNRMMRTLERVTPQCDPKLAAIVNALEKIGSDAEHDAISDEDARQKRKVIIFSFFADTVAYLRKHLAIEVDSHQALGAYRGRIVAVAGSAVVETDDAGRQHAVSGFAPISTESNSPDRFAILITTDVLAEGVNLQQCRHIINYDVPWNPMRLVQRHGRIDRIGSRHSRVFLRTIFPAERLDDLLDLEQRILQKIALAAASIGVASPIQGGAAGRQVFTETREEIERLLEEDPTLFERGGTGGATQTGEEYRQTLRRALDRNPDRIKRMPWGIGSGMAKGKHWGVFFCTAVGDRTYLRFLETDSDWQFDRGNTPIVHEIGTCLRLIGCEETTPRLVPRNLEDAVFDLWEIARDDIWASWMTETDPANLQPNIRPLNQRVAEFIRANRPPDDEAREVTNALDILESPWPRREEIMLREWFAEPSRVGVEKSRFLITKIRGTGLEPFVQPKLLPPIELEDIRLVCWMGLSPSAAGSSMPR
jgi:hypothetical protein